MKQEETKGQVMPPQGRDLKEAGIQTAHAHGGTAEIPAPSERKRIPRDAVVQTVDAERETFAPEDPVDTILSIFEKTSRPLSYFASTDPPPVTWLVDRLIEDGTLTLMYGGAGSLKSFFVEDLVIAVASKVPFLNPSPGDASAPAARKTTHGQVIWLDADIGLRGTHRRLHALAAGYGVSDGALEVLSFPPFDLDNQAAVDALVRLIVKKKARILVIDVLAHVLGVGDENDAAALRKPLQSLRRIVEETGCSIIALHHPRKGGSTGESHDDLRGSSALAGAVDLLLRIERPDRSKTRITIVSTKTRGVEITPLSAELSTESDAVGKLVSARFFGVAHRTTAQCSDSDRRTAVVEALANSKDPLSSTKLKKKVGGRAQETTNTISALVKDGSVIETPGPRGAKFYALKP